MCRMQLVHIYISREEKYANPKRERINEDRAHTGVPTDQRLLNHREVGVAPLLQGCHVFARDGVLPHARVHGGGKKQRFVQRPGAHHAHLATQSCTTVHAATANYPFFDRSMNCITC